MAHPGAAIHTYPDRRVDPKYESTRETDLYPGIRRH